MIIEFYFSDNEQSREIFRLIADHMTKTPLDNLAAEKILRKILDTPGDILFKSLTLDTSDEYTSLALKRNGSYEFSSYSNKPAQP